MTDRRNFNRAKQRLKYADDNIEDALDELRSYAMDQDETETILRLLDRIQLSISGMISQYHQEMKEKFGVKIKKG